MLWLILGDYGAGKTLRLVLEAFSVEYENRTIYANFEIKHPQIKKRFKLITVPDLKDIENCVVLLDEMQNWFNSHDSLSVDNEFFTDFIHDCDKRNVDVFGTSHRFMSIEIDFRMGCHRIIKCQRIDRFGQIAQRNPNIKRLEDKRDFHYQVFTMFDGHIIDDSILYYEDSIPYFSVYNTKNRIKRPQNKLRDLKLILKHNPEKALELLVEIIESLYPIFSNGVKLTHDELDWQLAKLDYAPDEKINGLIYAQLLKKLSRGRDLKKPKKKSNV